MDLQRFTVPRSRELPGNLGVVNAKYYCEETWLSNQENGLCYKLFPKPQSWKQARETCTREGGFLVSITSDHVMLFVVKNILDNATLVWTGGHSLYDNGWMWDNYQEPFNSTFWISGALEPKFRCLALNGLTKPVWLDRPCTDQNAFICEKSAKALNCDGKPNVIQLQPNKLTAISFPPFYDPLRPFQLPSYETNLNCVWNIVPPDGYRIIMEYYLFCNDDLKGFQGNSRLENVSCREHFGSSAVDRSLSLSFRTDSYTRPRSEQGFQFRLFTANNKVFAKSVILEESGVFVYREETITVNYTSNGSYSGPHGFVLEYYIDEKSVAACTQKNQSKEVSQYGVPNPMNKYIIFSVKATNDIELSLHTPPGGQYYIAFNQSFTGSLCIRKTTASLTQCFEEYNGKLLDNGAFRDFWVSWFDTLKVGRGRIPGNDVILDFRVYNPLNVSSISIQARDGIGEWNFFGPVNSTEMINITRSQVAPSSQGIEGSTLTMTVDINIRFGFGVKWLRNGTQVSHSPGRFLIQQSFIDVMKCSLDILELKLRDQANWTVVVYNQHYTASTSFDIRGGVVCPSSVDVHGIPWPIAIPGKYVHADCPNGKEVELTIPILQLQILESDGVSDKEYIEQKFQTSLTKTENLTASEQTISSANILSSISIIDTVLKVANQSNATVPNQNVYSIFDHVTSANNKESWKLVEEETMAGPTSVLDAMEKTNSLVMKDSKVKEFRGNNIASKYSAVLYKTMSQFLPSKANSSRSGPDSVVNSAVMSLTFDQPIQQLSPPLVLTFQHNTGRRMADEDADCVFWDYALFDGTGGWSSEGCSTNSTEGGTTVCLCNHTTNFAILMRPYTPEKEDSALVIISIVGVVISMLFTVLTVGIYIYLWKKIKSDQNVLIICLCVSLFLGYLVFLTGVDNADNEAVCIAVTALLHFFLLTTFFMMFGVGTFFFMNVTLNLGIIISLLRVMFLTTKMKKAEFKEKARNALKSVCTLIPVLGVTWIFGIFAINEDAIVFQYIFTIANSIQIKKTMRAKHPSLKKKRDKDVDHVVSSTTDHSTNNTHTTALVPVNNSVYIVGGKIITQSGSATHLQTDSRNEAFELKVSSEGVLHEEKKKEVRWGGGGGIIQNFQSEANKYREMRPTRECRVVQTKVERTRVVTSNTSQFSAQYNNTKQSKFFTNEE
uniref:Latrophilin-3 n=1 Tax=Magallana gigas TaxID=29159 RepID=K1RKF3_MAGGI